MGLKIVLTRPTTSDTLYFLRKHKREHDSIFHFSNKRLYLANHEHTAVKSTDSAVMRVDRAIVFTSAR